MIKPVLCILTQHPHNSESPAVTWPWASEVWLRASLQFGETQIATVLCSSVSPSIIHPSIHPSIVAGCRPFFPSGTLLCIMQQGPYHSLVIDIPSPAQLIAGAPVKHPHETEGQETPWCVYLMHKGEGTKIKGKEISKRAETNMRR